MKQITPFTRTISIPEHTEHYTSASGRVAKIDPAIEEHSYNLHLSASGEGYQQSFYSLGFSQAERLLKLFLVGPEAQVNECFSDWINQAERDCEVIKVNKVRARIWYEMPNAGDQEAWRRIVTLAGVKFIDDGWETVTAILRRQ